MSGLYVYAIVARDAGLSDPLTGFDDAVVRVVPAGSLAAVVSAIDGATPRPDAEQVLRHEAIVEAIREQTPGLPARFGTFLSDQDAVARAVAEQEATLERDLLRVGDKIEFGVTMLWRETESDHETPAADARNTGAAGPGARYLQRRLAEHQRDVSARQRAESLAEELESALAPHVAETRVTAVAHGKLALRAACLLERRQESAFRDACDAFRARHAEARMLRMLLSGPWSPYTFVTAGRSSERALAQVARRAVERLA
jgi:hypothetical protein